MIRKTLLLISLLTLSSTGYAYKIGGSVYCDVNENNQIDGMDTPLAGVDVLMQQETPPNHLAMRTTSAAGTYLADLYVFEGLGHDAQGDWSVYLDGADVNGPVVQPPGGVHEYTLTLGGLEQALDADFLVDDPSCQEPEEPGLCWMTAGGVKFARSLTGDLPLAEKGPKDSFGGNVHPSCSSEPGNGGQWNHIAHSEKLHFLGTDIIVTECGNVPGIDPGSESPETGFNYIEFMGTGWVQGIQGNKLKRTAVTFEARIEDRNEPGNEQSSAGADIDQYRIIVRDGGGQVLLNVSDPDMTDGDDLITITGGNLQLHESSCDN